MVLCARSREYEIMTMKTDGTLYELQKVIANAVSSITMFRNLYGRLPHINCFEDFRKLPTTNRSDYEKLQDVSDCLQNPWNMTTSVAPWDCSYPKFPLSVLHSAEDEMVLEERVRYLLEQLALTKGRRLTLLIDDIQLYAASDLSDILIYLGYPCEMILINGRSECALRERIAKTHATSVFLCSDQNLSDEVFSPCVEHVVGFNHQQKSRRVHLGRDIFHLDEIPMVAVNAGDGRYHSPAGHFFFEQSDRGTLLITTLQQDYSPFIRYDTGARAIVSENSFQLGD